MSTNADKPQFRSLLAWPLALTALYLIGFYLFANGFLLSRSALDTASTCNDTLAFAFDKPEGSCWGLNKHKQAYQQPSLNSPNTCVTTRKRVVLLVVDALRYDFVAPQIDSNLPFHNQLPYMQSLLTNKTRHTKLFKFIADAPTTTLQRLKGLTTGGLPTFMDMSSNFDGSAITEDNIITQLATLKRDMRFVGDDTWIELFPSQFTVAKPHPSFNVRDLDSNDIVVRQYLPQFLQETKTQLVVGHELGVDHCGHRFGPFHPAMTRKLNEVDEHVRKIVSMLREDDVLVVMGDHGMTAAGNHGGDTKQEIEAALFVYSTQPFPAIPQGLQSSQVDQIDLPPTLAMLLDVPIPFGSLGWLIPELVPSQGSSTVHLKRLLQMARANAWQIHRFLEHYSLVSSDIGEAERNLLEDGFVKADHYYKQLQKENQTDTSEHVKVLKAYRAYVHAAQTEARKAWTTFDIPLMVAGLVVLSSALLLNWTLARSTIIPPSVISVLIICLLGCALSAAVMLGQDVLSVPLATSTKASPTALGVAILGLVLGISVWVWAASARTLLTFSASSALIACLIAARALGTLSNSFVVYDDVIAAYFLRVLIVLQTAVAVTYDGPWLTRLASGVCGIVVLLAVLVGESYRYCREEQEGCVSIESGGVISDSSLTLASLVLAASNLAHWLWSYQNGTFFGLNWARVKLLLPILVLVTTFEWSYEKMQGAASMSSNSSQDELLDRIKLLSQLLKIDLLNPTIRLLFPRIAMAINLSTFVGAFVFPTNAELNIVRSKDDSVTVLATGVSAMQSTTVLLVFASFVNQAFLLTPAWAVPSIGMLAAACIGYCMLLGYGLLNQHAAATTTVRSHLDGAKVIKTRQGQTALMLSPKDLATSNESQPSAVHDPLEASWLEIGTWYLIGVVFFYWSNHQATMSSLAWSAGLVGLEDMVFAISGLHVWVSTFIGPLLVATCYPLLLYLRLVTANNRTPPSEHHAGEYGDYWLMAHHGKAAPSAILRSGFKLHLCFGVTAVASCFAACVLRRHLMVWKIFAPRVIFEFAIFITGSFGLLLAACLVTRVSQAADAIRLKIEAAGRKDR
eukprot:m.167604 g.167604  ORF g.167604 m.167604 type:complete len:1079 (-) comp16641_c0_seq7:782-4018(-)